MPAVAAVAGGWQGSPLRQAAGAAFPADSCHARPPLTPPLPACRPGPSSGRRQETGIVPDELIAEPCRETGWAEMKEIVVEVAELRPQRQG